MASSSGDELDSSTQSLYFSVASPKWVLGHYSSRIAARALPYHSTYGGWWIPVRTVCPTRTTLTPSNGATTTSGRHLNLHQPSAASESTPSFGGLESTLSDEELRSWTESSLQDFQEPLYFNNGNYGNYQVRQGLTEPNSILQPDAFPIDPLMDLSNVTSAMSGTEGMLKSPLHLSSVIDRYEDAITESGSQNGTLAIGARDSVPKCQLSNLEDDGTLDAFGVRHSLMSLSVREQRNQLFADLDGTQPTVRDAPNEPSTEEFQQAPLAVLQPGNRDDHSSTGYAACTPSETGPVPTEGILETASAKMTPRRPRRHRQQFAYLSTCARPLTMSCSICQQRFTGNYARTNLRRHKVNVHEKKYFWQCQLRNERGISCLAAIERVDNRARHIEELHPKEWTEAQMPPRDSERRTPNPIIHEKLNMWFEKCRNG